MEYRQGLALAWLTLGRLNTEAARFDWRAHARASQLAPEGDWRVWLLLAGRGFGKTRAGAEWVREQVFLHGRKRLALVAPTAADARDVVVEGQSGVLAVSPNDQRPLYEPSKRRLTWPNGAMATLFSADEPDRLRGPNFDAAWVDELSVWRYPEAWDMLMFGLRLGPDPRVVVTATPQPTKLIRDLMAAPTTVVTRGTTYENKDNLPPAFLDAILKRYEGTRLGRQEIYGELLEDVPGALWTGAAIERDRLPYDFLLPEMKRIVVAIDPAMTSGEEADETGIVVAGADHHGHAYVFADVSGHYQPIDWAQAAIAQFYHPDRHADRIVAEVNNGGDMVQHTLRMVDPTIPFTAVHASRGKVIRAEPVSALYEQGRVHHVGIFPELEQQMCFPAGTLIETDRGQVPIEQVKAADQVLTRAGYRAASIACKTGCCSAFVVIQTTDGRSLRCTPNHPIYDLGQDKFVPAWSVAPGMRLSGAPSSANMAHRLLGAVIGINVWRAAITAVRAAQQAANSCIMQFGRRIVANCLPEPNCITSTTIPATICSRTSSHWFVSNITANTNTNGMALRYGVPSGAQLTRKTPGKPANGTSSLVVGAANPAERRIKTKLDFAAMPADNATEPLGKWQDGCGIVRSVASHSKQKIQEGNIVVANVTIEHTEEESIYNLRVDELAEYYANGILVHNCSFTVDWDRAANGSPDRVDALVWAIHELMIEGSQPDYLAAWGRWD